MGSSWTDSLGVAFLGVDVPRHVAAWARAAERAGLGSLWLIEDYFYPGAFALAGAAAAVTERAVVGLGVVNPYTRHPALLAMETAALAGLAPGRVVLGLGASNRVWIEERMGIPFTAPLESVREGVEIVRRLLAGERLTFRGRRFAVDAVRLESAPEQAVPIFLGVKGPKALGLAGEIADGVHCAILASPAHVRRVRATAGAARAVGAGPLTVIAYVPLAVGRDGAAARAALRPFVARYLGFLHGQSILADAGLDAVRTRPFREALLRGERAGHLVTDEVLDAVAVAGTPADCRRALARWADAGLDAAVAVVPREADMLEQLALIGAELSPHWKDVRAGGRRGAGAPPSEASL
ncbi:MAG: LLM class flavin-dependent oxidoreductase [Candidatus Rokubacteria bacterium]|nr:LLM class flavin-dependent oxidoreductase [Candidatus Rokubacteria bacterium]